MQYPIPLVFLFAATAVLAVPLNINMGAYSPALVVGDGAIGFKNGASVTQLMNTLEGAAANSAAANGAANAGTTTTKAAEVAAPAVVASAAPAATTSVVPVVAESELPQGMGKSKHVISRGLTADEQAEIDEEVENEDGE